MSSTLNQKRIVLLMLAGVGLAAAIACAAVLALGVREPTRERLFLVGSIFIVSAVCLFLALRFKDDALQLEDAARGDAGHGPASPQDAPSPAPSDPDDVPLPQNAPDGDGRRG